MEIVFLLLPLALILAALGALAFIWSVRSGQFDDLETPGLRMLNDETERRREAERKGNS
jgi:cbb3-type cytochrome oxidase maturation protein